MPLNLFKNCFLAFLLVGSQASYAQIGNIVLVQEKDKPEKFQSKTLRSEKTGNKKFTIPRRIIQNTTTHYNYYFNANNKLNAVLEQARTSVKDDYSKLLPFYGYSLESTASQSSELDSVIYKATAGILLHDLRSDWVDNMYLLIGKAYLLKKELDSASMTFQFINYNLYPKKKKNEDQLIVGTNENAANRTVSIANKEKRSLLKKIFTMPPSRNDALVWQARVLIEMEEYTDAAGLINTLQADPNLPKRLDPDLEEVNAFWFYKQKIYDSAAAHLEKGLANAENKQDRARWEFLLAQMYERSKNMDKAGSYYAKAIKHTVDPMLDIYARLNRAKMFKSKDPKELDNSISNLLSMARRDKFDKYRDILYYSAAELALEKPDTLAAISYLNRGLEKPSENGSYKLKTFYRLADIAFHRKDFRTARSYYDSLQTADSSLGEDLAKIQQRRETLGSIIDQADIVYREDSLQRVAALAPADREVFLKKLLKKLRKEKGLKEDDAGLGGSGNILALQDNKNTSLDLFSANDSKSGDFYFYNSSLKAKGYTEFRSKWGKRLNVDNWRFRSASEVSNTAGTTPGAPTDARPSDVATTDTTNKELSIEGLTANLPLTADQLSRSNTTWSGSLYTLGKLYQNALEEYKLAAEIYEESLQRFPDSLYNGEIYLSLYYCYQKLGNDAKANFYKNQLQTKFGDGKYGQALAGLSGTAKVVDKNAEATKTYESVYTAFYRGGF